MGEIGGKAKGLMLTQKAENPQITISAHWEE
jgi:hypothetical protein